MVIALGPIEPEEAVFEFVRAKPAWQNLVSRSFLRSPVHVCHSLGDAGGFFHLIPQLPQLRDAASGALHLV